MPHGTPDWGLVGPKSTTYGLDDLGEHAVRLGSPHFFDRRGDVMFQTDFRDGLGDVYVATTGTNGRAQLWTGYSRTGPYCLGLYCASDGTHEAVLWKDLPYAVASSFGLECSWSDDATIIFIAFGFQFVTPVLTYNADVRWVRIGSVLEYVNAGGVRVPFAAGVSYDNIPRVGNTVKLVGDLVNNNYMRVLWNNTLYSLAGIPLNGPGGGGPARLACYVRVVGTNLVHTEVHVDNVIITQNEP